MREHRCRELRVKRQDPHAALQQRKPSEERLRTVFSAQSDARAFSDALLMKARRQRVDTLA
ncbi:hypothetical protein GCM10011513_33880 [Franconibacter daqui]|nr:hypothetical protein GCM10011513_33880 [Franconibacter daqui]